MLARVVEALTDKIKCYGAQVRVQVSYLIRYGCGDTEIFKKLGYRRAYI
jgi:hypothetical protein